MDLGANACVRTRHPTQPMRPHWQLVGYIIYTDQLSMVPILILLRLKSENHIARCGRE